ncbi:unnamed protein product, partial [Rotaria magnacalcarata]
QNNQQPAPKPKYYPNQFNNNPQAKFCQNYEQQINWEGNNQNVIQGLESVNLSVPPPSCNFMSNENNINPSLDTGHVGYAGVGSNPDYGSVPNQQIQAQQSSKPKDNPPFKNTPPGFCNYCERRGHGRQTCKYLKAREQEPHLTWCNLCLMKNHKEIHCTYKVKFTPTISSNNYNKNSPKPVTQQVKYIQYPPKLNTFEYNKIRVFTNSKFHSQEYNVKKDITKRLSQLSPDLRAKVLNTYTSDSPKNNFIICPHYNIQDNKNCHFCKNSHPELLKLEIVIASYSNKFIAPSTVPTITKSSTSTVHNNVPSQLNIHNNSVPKDQNIVNKSVQSNLNKKSKLNSKVKGKRGKEVKKCKQTHLEEHSNNNQNRKNHLKWSNDNSNIPDYKNQSLKLKEPLPDAQISPIKELENECNTEWTKELDKEYDAQASKISTVIYQGQVKSRAVHNNNPFDAGSSILINSLHAPYPSTYGITNTPRRIKITNESFNTDTTVRNVKTNYFWVNLNNHFIYTLVDSGADRSSIRKDILDKFKIEMLPLNEDECKFTDSLTVLPKLNEDTDELVLGHDFLVSKELTFCGDRHLLRGYYKEGIIWTYQSEESKVTRILSDISCYSKSAFKVKPNSTVETPVRVDLPSYLVDDNANYIIKNFSYATYLNLIRPLNIDDLPDDGSPKYQLRYYTSYPDNFYIANLKEPIFELENQTPKELSYKDNSLVGKAYNIFTIFMNRLNVEEQYQNKYLTIKDKGNYMVEPHVRECFIKTNVEVGSSLNGTNIIKINSNNDSGFHETVNTVPNDTGTDFSNLTLNDGNYFNQELKIILDDDLINKDQINNDDPLLSDFNPPDECDLKDPSEWTKESLNDSVKVEPCTDEIKKKFLEILWQNKDTVSNSTTVAPSSLPEVQWIPGKDNTWPDMLSRTFNWDRTLNDQLIFEETMTYDFLPPDVTLDEISSVSGDSLLFSLYKGMSNIKPGMESTDYPQISHLRDELFNEINKNREKYNLVINSTNQQKWLAHRNRHHPLPINFIQAFANKEGINVEMYYGLETPIIFKSEKLKTSKPKIIIQSLANHHFNLLKYSDDKLNAKAEYENYIQNKIMVSFDNLVNIDNLLGKDESAAYDELVTDTTDSSLYFALAQNDFKPTLSDYAEKRSQNIETITQDIKRVSAHYDKYDKMTYDQLFHPSDPTDNLDLNKVYDQDLDGKFREVHPDSYGNWYSRCCNHRYNTECFIPLSCGDIRFCAVLDTGSTCSVLNMTVANKLFKEGHLKKLKDTKINLVGAGGLAQHINTRIVTANISMGTARLVGAKFILLPDDMMFSCALIGTEILSQKGMELDFGTRVVSFDDRIIIEMARLKHPRFYNHRYAPLIENNLVAPANTVPYIHSINPEADKEFDSIFNKLSQTVDDR